MAYREVSRVEIGEVIRRWQAGEGLRKIASGTGLSRITVRKYVAAAQELGLSREGAGPSEEQLSRLAGISQSGPRQVQIPSEEVLAPWTDQVYRWQTDPHPGVAGGQGLPDLVFVPAPVDPAAQLAAAQGRSPGLSSLLA